MLAVRFAAFGFFAGVPATGVAYTATRDTGSPRSSLTLMSSVPATHRHAKPMAISEAVAIRAPVRGGRRVRMLTIRVSHETRC